MRAMGGCVRARLKRALSASGILSSRIISQVTANLQYHFYSTTFTAPFTVPHLQCHIFSTKFTVPHLQCRIYSTTFSLPYLKYHIYSTTFTVPHSTTITVPHWHARSSGRQQLIYSTVLPCSRDLRVTKTQIIRAGIVSCKGIRSIYWSKHCFQKYIFDTIHSNASNGQTAEDILHYIALQCTNFNV